MKKEQIVVDGEIMEIVVELPTEIKEENILNDELEDTLDLEEILEKTRKIEVGGIGE